MTLDSQATYADAAQAEELVTAAADAVASGSKALEQALEQLGAPIYVTDAEGTITFFTSACIDFAGRRPETGRDRWCVTWKLYDLDGNAMPHDRCPMAQAIREKRPNRGLMALAARPDGTFVPFMPFPTPILDAQGDLVGAVNLLLGFDPPVQAKRLREDSAWCRRLASSILDRQARTALMAMAFDYETRAQSLEKVSPDRR